MAIAPDPPATLARAIADVTGDLIDLRPLSQVAWFRVVAGPARGQASLDQTGDSISYSAFGVSYLNVVIDSNAIRAFESAVDRMGPVMDGLAEGRRGYLVADSVDRFRDSVASLEKSVDSRIDDFGMRVIQLTSGHAGVVGRAVDVLVRRLTAMVTDLQHWHDRLRQSGRPLSSLIGASGSALQGFRTDITGQWARATAAGLRGNIRHAINNVVANVVAHLTGQGVVAGAPGYNLDDGNPALHPGSLQTPQQFHAAADGKIQSALATYAGGDLRLQSTWDAINAQIVTASVARLLDDLDSTAAAAGAVLDTAYRAVGDALAAWLGRAGAGEAPPGPGTGPSAKGHSMAGGSGSAGGPVLAVVPAGSPGGTAAGGPGPGKGDRGLADDGASATANDLAAHDFGPSAAVGASAVALAGTPGSAFPALNTGDPVGLERGGFGTSAMSIGVPGRDAELPQPGDAGSSDPSTIAAFAVLGAIGRPSAEAKSRRRPREAAAYAFTPSESSPGATTTPVAEPSVTQTPIRSAAMNGPTWPLSPGGFGPRGRRSERITWLGEDDAVWGARGGAGAGVVGLEPTAAAKSRHVGEPVLDPVDVSLGVIGRPQPKPTTTARHSA